MSVIVVGYEGVRMELLPKEGLRVISRAATHEETFSRIAKTLLVADPSDQVLLSDDPVMAAMAVMIWTHIQKQAHFLVFDQNKEAYSHFAIDRSNVVQVIEATKDYLNRLKEER